MAPLHPWIWPSKPWQRTHVDFAGPFLGKMFFVVIDAHSKWPEIFEMLTTTAAKTITVLCHIFVKYGIPEQLVSDSGPQFIADEFDQFMRGNGIQHVRSAPYYPASNGLAERFVRTFKEAMKAAKQDGFSLPQWFENFLLTYHTTPNATTSQSPCTLFLEETYVPAGTS